MSKNKKNIFFPFTAFKNNCIMHRHVCVMRIWPNFELLRALMHVIITCKYEKDRIKNSREKVETSSFRRSRAGNSVVRGRIWPNFEIIQAFMYVIITCKYEKDPIKFS